MQIQGACLLYPVALFGRAWWIYYDSMSQGWAGLCKYQVSPSLEAGEGRKKRDLSKRVKSGLLHGLGRFWVWVEPLATSSPIRPCRRICRWSWRLLHRQSRRLFACHDILWPLPLQT